MRGLRVPVVVGLLFAVLWIAGAGAKAQPYPPPTPTVIASLSPSPSAPPPTDTPSAPPTIVPSRGPTPTPDIPFTGADLTRFVLIGAALTGIGMFLVRLARRPSGGR
ncbi:MAG: hypothetical protein M3323_14365 [Actinomycetota bacterium]|nr:hypothetical protein [Actinomycetota bacterium]